MFWKIFFRGAMKGKIKLSLIDDYIRLYLAKKKLKNNNSFFQFYNELENLCNVYENLFFKIGLMDFSFLKLKKDLNETEVDYLNFNFEKIKQETEEINKNLFIKLKKLKFNEAEMFYVNKNLIKS